MSSLGFGAGLRYVDTAPYYGFGLSETRLGRAFGAPETPSGPWVSTQVGRVLTPMSGLEPARTADEFVDAPPVEVRFDYSYDGVMRSFESSLDRLGLERVDILLAHDLGRATHDEANLDIFQTFFLGGYLAMCRLKDQGAAGDIGVDEIEVRLATLDPVDLNVILLAGRYSLLEQGAMDRLLPVGAAALQFSLGHPAVVSVVAGMGRPHQVIEAVDFINSPIPDALWAELKAEGLVHADAPCPLETPRVVQVVA